MSEITAYPDGYLGPIIPRTDRLAVAKSISALLLHLDDRPRDPEWVLEQMRLAEQSPENHLHLIVVKNGIVVASSNISRTVETWAGPEGHLGAVVVHPEYRGRENGNLAQRMWDEGIRWCQESGIADLHFVSENHRQAAWAFYLRNGAEIIGQIGDTAHFHATIPPLATPDGVTAS